MSDLAWDAASPPGQSRLKPIPFHHIGLTTEPRYLVKGLIPREGLVVIWGPPKCGKSFYTFDLTMRVALGWKYRGRRVAQGAVVYCAAEGQHGFRARIEAFRQEHLGEEGPPFYLVPARLCLTTDAPELVRQIKVALNDDKPAAVVIDTLNRSLAGSENSDQDMTEYVAAADMIRETFGCACIIVHHCGVEGTRPRGHTSLTGAVDAQLAVRKDAAGTITTTVEFMKDGEEGEQIHSKLEQVEVGADIDGDVITSCVVIPADPPARSERGNDMTPNQSTMLELLRDANPDGLTVDEWNQLARDAGLGSQRRANLIDYRSALKRKGKVYEFDGRWHVSKE